MSWQRKVLLSWVAVEIAGHDVINHAGAAALRIIADRTGLTSGLFRALARPGFVPVHDRGRVLADAAVLIADGGRVLALLLGQGSAGSHTATDHHTVLDEAITQIPARYRRNLLITVDGAGASHGLVDHITTLNASPWHTVHYSIGWELAAENARPSTASRIRLRRRPRPAGPAA